MVAIDGFTAVTSNNNGAAVGSPVYTLGTVGVAAQAPVPEPAAWALMIGGFALGGAAMRQRRAAVRFA
ncbi:MAG: PEPxxWA-CTERM sorting domain-containing protein [Sphingobium sp.]|nr:PEPxxWA-CTERM sorting domain-containing protein [Sphingobium sp.]